MLQNMLLMLHNNKFDTLFNKVHLSGSGVYRWLGR